MQACKETPTKKTIEIINNNGSTLYNLTGATEAGLLCKLAGVTELPLRHASSLGGLRLHVLHRNGAKYVPPKDCPTLEPIK